MSDKFTDVESSLCCLFRHANAVPPWTCDCPCHQLQTDEPPPEESCSCSVPDFVGYVAEPQNWRCLICGKHPDANERIHVRLIARQ